MGQRGVHFALTAKHVAKLRGLAEDDARVEFLEAEIEEKLLGGNGKHAAESDKAWDAIHRALSDGKLTWAGGTYPLNHVVLGGESLFAGDDYAMSLKTPPQVRDIATALDSVTKTAFRERYDRIDQETYPRELDKDDFDCTWRWFEEVREFYQRAAAAERFVLFTVDSPEISPAGEPVPTRPRARDTSHGLPKLSDDEWYRVGGSWFSCGLPLQDCVAALASGLPADYAPYIVVGEDVLPLARATEAEVAEKLRRVAALNGDEQTAKRLRRRRAQFFRRLFSYPLEDIERALDESPEDGALDRSRLWLGSLALSPWLEQLAISDDAGILTINGLTLLDFGGTQGRRQLGSLTAVVKIRHEETGKLHVQREYGEIHRAVRKALSVLARKHAKRRPI